MAAEMNGIALHGNTRIYGGTFLVFSDYMRNAVRLSALMQLPVTYVWTHDSIGLGEDGPTHQPVEHLASLRAIPGLNVVRPADANETAIAWAEILRRHATDPAPHGLALTRQGVPTYAPNPDAAQGRLRPGRTPPPRRPTSSSSPPAPRCSSPSPRGSGWRPRGSAPGWCRCRPWSGSRSSRASTARASFRRP